MISATSVACTAQALDLPDGIVHVQPYGPFGSKVAPSQITVRLYTSEGKLVPEKPSSNLTLKGVPYGVYRLLVFAAGGGSGECTLRVNTKEMWVKVGLAISYGDTLGPTGFLIISGDIKPGPSPGSDWWVRAEGMFLNRRKEEPVGTSGKFSIGGLDMGTYLVEVFEGSKLRHVETVEIDTNQLDTHLTISLQSNGAER